nr:MAG TPA: hypothetical protein [Caudoviricetes sp.]
MKKAARQTERLEYQRNPAGTIRLLVGRCSPVAAGQYKSRRVLDALQFLAAFAV